MADIIGSRKKDQNKLMEDFKEITKSITKEHKEWFLSPITITLGDEFQCIANDLLDSVRIMFEIEEKIIKQEKGFRLKYVLVEGKIETPINKRIAHEMMGPGLTRARGLLTDLKKSIFSRFNCELNVEKVGYDLNLAFVVYQSFVDSWNIKKDYYLVAEFLETDDYKKVAEKLNKNRSLMWKREHNLKIKQYKAIKNLIEDLVEDYK
jgi:hypothetical protein